MSSESFGANQNTTQPWTAESVGAPNPQRTILEGKYSVPNPYKLGAINSSERYKHISDYVAAVTTYIFELAGIVEPIIDVEQDDSPDGPILDPAQQYARDLFAQVLAARDLFYSYHQPEFEQLARLTQDFTPKKVSVLKILKVMAGSPDKPDEIMLRQYTADAIRDIILLLICQQEGIAVPQAPTRVVELADTGDPEEAVE